MATSTDKVWENAAVSESYDIINEVRPRLKELAEKNLPELIKLFDDVVAEARNKKSLAANTTKPGTSPGNGSSVTTPGNAANF